VEVALGAVSSCVVLGTTATNVGRIAITVVFGLIVADLAGAIFGFPVRGLQSVPVLVYVCVRGRLECTGDVTGQAQDFDLLFSQNRYPLGAVQIVTIGALVGGAEPEYGYGPAAETQGKETG
jgi:hypothetical protein